MGPVGGGPPARDRRATSAHRGRPAAARNGGTRVDRTRTGYRPARQRLTPRPRASTHHHASPHLASPVIFPHSRSPPAPLRTPAHPAPISCTDPHPRSTPTHRSSDRTPEVRRRPPRQDTKERSPMRVKLVTATLSTLLIAV